MCLTCKAKEEIAQLQAEIINLDQEYKGISNKLLKENDQLYRKALNRESDRIWRKKNSKEERIKEIEKLGISSKEQTSLKKELTWFKTITSERILGSCDYTVIGKSKVLGDLYIKVTYCKFSNFMHNVKGCGGLARKIDIYEVIELSQKEYDKLSNSNSVYKTNFIGSSERIIAPNGEVIQEK